MAPLASIAGADARDFVSGEIIDHDDVVLRRLGASTVST